MLKKITSPVNRVIAIILLCLIRGYQWLISPLYTPCCKYTPSCSAFAKEAIMTFGPYRGSLLAVKRLLRCHPFAKGGVDFVPTNNKKNKCLSTLEETKESH